MREVIIPELTKEVNEDKNFAPLRQIYNSLILATWYKKKIKDSILSKVYSDKSKVAGVKNDDPQEKEKIYQRYLSAFKKGVFNYIKEDLDPMTSEMMPRKYFSGGVPLFETGHILRVGTDDAMIGSLLDGRNYLEEVRFDEAMTTKPRADQAMNMDIPARAFNAMNLTEIKATVNNFQQNANWRRKLWPGVSRFKTTFRSLNYWKLRAIDFIFAKNYTDDLMGFEQLELEEYTAFLGKISRKFNLRSKIVFYPFGGFSPLQPFALTDATDVVSVGTEKWGNPDDIKTCFDLNKESVYENFSFFDSIRFFHEMLTNHPSLHGLGGVALLRIISLLRGDIKGIRFFRINQNGTLTFMENPNESFENFPDAVVEFDVDINGKKARKRYWYIHQYIENSNSAFDNFVNKLPFELLLFIAAPTGLFVDKPRSAVIERILKPTKAKLNPVKVFHDQVLPEYDPAKNSPYPIWKNPVLLTKYRLGPFETLGYSDGAGYGGGVVYSGSVQNLITEDSAQLSKVTISVHYKRKGASIYKNQISKNGGIDLTSANMNLETQNSVGSIKFHLDPAMLQRLQNAPGFVPVIINVQPMTNLRLFLAGIGHSTSTSS